MKFITVSRLHATCLLIIIFFIGGMIIAINNLFGIIFLTLFSSLYIFFCFVYTVRFYHNFDLQVNKNEFIIYKGFLKRKKVIISHTNIQTITVYSTPIQKLFSTRSIVLRLPKKSVHIPEIDYRKINTIISTNIKYGKEGTKYDKRK